MPLRNRQSLPGADVQAHRGKPNLSDRGIARALRILEELRKRLKRKPTLAEIEAEIDRTCHKHA